MNDDYTIPPGQPAEWTEEQIAIACRNLEKNPDTKVRERKRPSRRPRFVDEWGLEEELAKERGE